MEFGNYISGYMDTELKTDVGQNYTPIYKIIKYLKHNTVLLRWEN